LKALTTLIILTGIVSFSCASAQYENLVHKTYAQRVLPLFRFYQDTVRRADSITIFRKINAIQKLAVDNDDDDLQAEALLLRAHYFYYRDEEFSPAKISSVLDSLLATSIKIKKLWLQIMAENLLALYNFDHLQQYELGFEHHKKVYALVKDVPASEFPYKQSCLNQIADRCYSFTEYRESIFYNQEALQADPTFKLYNVPLRITILNTVGLCYQKLGMLDSSDYYFRQALAAADINNCVPWQGIASGNLGNNCFLRGQYDQAIPLLQKDVDEAIKEADWGLASNSLMLLGNISLNRQDITKARQQLLTASQYAYWSGQYGRLQTLYPLLSKLYASLNQPSLASMYLDSAFFVKDSLARKLNRLQALRVEQKAKLDQYRAEMDSITKSKQINILERDILMGVVLIMMVLAVYFYRRQRQKQQRNLEQVKKAEEELAEATKQLNDFARSVTEKNTLLEILQQQSTGIDKSSLQQLQQSTILTEDDWIYFLRLFEKVHGDFFQRLKDKYPSLTPTESRFMVLSKLNLSSKEMAAMLGVSTDTIRQHRLRARKKLQLSEEANLEAVIAEI